MEAKNLIIFCSILLFQCTATFAQGPKLSHYYQPETELSWASCFIYNESGNKQKIGFFPVINEATNGPMGTNNYKSDIEIEADLVFMGGGRQLAKISDLANSPNLKDKALLFFDRPLKSSQPEEVPPLENSIRTAMDLGAAAVVVISGDDSYPLFAVTLDREIPVISIDRRNAETIFKMAGFDAGKLNLQMPGHKKLPVSISFHIEGAFNTTETDNFEYHFHKSTISNLEADQIMADNEKAIPFLEKLFAREELKWAKERICYFGDFESKIFYTGYWGRGFSCDEGVYNVYIPENNSYGLAVHENTHSLMRKNGLSFCSFFDEGIARYAEATATGEDINNGPTAGFLPNDSLLRLAELIDINIGTNLQETKVAYPAAGSFVEFLATHHGQELVLKLNTKTFDDALRKKILSYEKAWLKWLCDLYQINPTYIDDHFNRHE